jgi:hypothetical protein
MTTNKKSKKVIEETPKEEEVVQKTSSPLIFISHDTRDAELAEEFSNLLKSASAGALKSFVSSDKKGTRGIEYGLEWYPAIMEKIDEASEVICLLTQRSVERPWILYEAGVAKGKLGKKVIGIAMGIQHSVAFTGPFAQFQNNDGSIDAITKLVLDLVRKVPGLDPDQKLVEQLVQNFHKKAGDIVAKSQKKTEKSPEVTNEKIVVKLFEEVKLMFESLPSRIENRIEPEFRRRRRKFHPMMFDEIMHMGMESKDPTLAFLVMISIYKDDLPWLYEIGLETYRGLKTAKTITEKKKIISSFERAFEMLGHPMMREFIGKSEDMHFFYKEVRHMMHNFIIRFYNDEKIKE